LGTCSLPCNANFAFLLLTSFVLHYSGFAVFDVIFDDDGKDEFSKGDRKLSIILFCITAASTLADIYGVHFHTAKSGYAAGVAPSPHLSPGRPRSGIWRSKPRVSRRGGGVPLVHLSLPQYLESRFTLISRQVSSVFSAVVDGLLLLGCIQSLVMQVGLWPVVIGTCAATRSIFVLLFCLQGDLSTIALIVLLILSLVFQVSWLDLAGRLECVCLGAVIV
jgi:hypothetical protein